MDTHLHEEMNHTDEEANNAHEEVKKEAKVISIRIPKIGLPTLQSGVLILLIIVGLLQTVQLFALDQKIANAKIGTGASSASSSSSAPTSGSTTSSLPNMVGGC